MFLYWTLFDDIPLGRKSYSISEKSSVAILQVFDKELKSGDEVEGCIAYYAGKINANRNCYEVKNAKVSINNSSIDIAYNAMNEIELESGVISKGIFRTAKAKQWISDTNPFSPVLCFVDETEFTRIRKGGGRARKHTSISAVIEEHRIANNWQAICDIFEPLETLQQRNPDVWNNTGDLYELAFACSKLGEPKDGMERDRQHLVMIARYRQASIRLFRRCEELDAEDFRYPSALGYRYYRSALELTKPRGRRDGKVDEEIENAVFYFEHALALYPGSVKDHYRLAKTLEMKLDRYMYATERNWTPEELQERNRIGTQISDHLLQVINSYRNLPEEKQSSLRKEYIKALYTLVRQSIDTINLHEKEYVKCIIFSVPNMIKIEKTELENILKAKEYMEECCRAEYSDFFNKAPTDDEWLNLSRDWSISAMDKFYRLGLVCLTMFYMKVVKDDSRNREEHYANADKYLQQARRLGDALRKRGVGGRSTWHISEKIAWLNILHTDYEKAINLLRPARDGYIKNTYAIGLALSKKPMNFDEAERALTDALSDSHNLQSSWSATLLCWLYELTGQEEKKKDIIVKHSNSLKKTYMKLLSLSPEEEHEG